MLWCQSLTQVHDKPADILYETGMARFFFNLHECGRIFSDEEGAEMPDVAAARANAINEARQIMAAEVLQGRLCLACHIEVLDNARRPLLIVAFNDAVVVSGN